MRGIKTSQSVYNVQYIFLLGVNVIPFMSFPMKIDFLNIILFKYYFSPFLKYILDYRR